MSEHTQILEQIKEVLDRALAIRNQIQAIVEQADKYKTEIAQLVHDTRNKDAELQLRERVVKQNEQRLLSVDAIDKRQNELEQLAAGIENQRKDCDRECSEKIAAASEEISKVEVLRRDLEMREKALEEEKRTYKETLLRKMGKLQEDSKCN